VCLLPNEDGTCGDKKQLGKNAPFLRHMLLKDIQLVDTDGPQSKPKVLRDQSASFCGDNLYSYPDPANPSQTLANKGLCSQTENTNGQIKIKGRWLQTINGAVYPKWNFSTDKPEIWRIQNASANLSYDLRLISAAWPDSADGAMPFQIVSIDGGAFGGGGDVNAPDLGFNTPEKLQRRMVLMPGSRAEILVTYRDPANCKLSPSKTTALCGAVIPPTTPQKITLQTNLFNTGDGGEIGDKWPQVQLAEVTITGGAQKILTSQTVAVLQDKTIAFSDAERQVASQNAKQKNNLGVVISPEATALCERKSAYRLDPAIEKRRIYFGIAVNPNKPNPIEEKANWREESFLMGNSIVRDNIEYEETPTGLVELPNGPILRPVNMNNMMPDGPSDLCIPFDTEEDWELVNVSPEVHNFHIHQNKFTVLQEQSKRRIRSPYDRLSMPSFGAGGSQSAEHDTVIVPRGVGTDCNTLIEPDPNDTTTLQQFIPIFRAGNEGNWDKLEGYHIRKQSKCRGNADDTSGMMTVHIPFTRKEVIGKYLFHCHILEHEDLGMMSTVRVLRP
jgi:FtsP/CotA-like multicopper oxidase with cupredoxin domain